MLSSARSVSSEVAISPLIHSSIYIFVNNAIASSSLLLSGPAAVACWHSFATPLNLHTPIPMTGSMQDMSKLSKQATSLVTSAHNFYDYCTWWHSWHVQATTLIWHVHATVLVRHIHAIALTWHVHVTALVYVSGPSISYRTGHYWNCLSWKR